MLSLVIGKISVFISMLLEVLTPLRLHDEISHFFTYVSPRSFERQMRDDLIRRVQAAFGRHIPNAIVQAFGSVATNLYLPNGDIDLVVMSSSYRYSGIPEIATHRRHLHTLMRSVIQTTRLGHNCQVIPSAKVPIIKFIDSKTFLPVDISFENDSGLKAITTLNNWLADYPALSRIVYLIKQFLKMRTLNEVNTGGLGGLSIICLVVFRLDILSRKHGQFWPRDNLDHVLLDFFDFYGSEFDFRTTGLDMGRMTYIPKVAHSQRPPCVDNVANMSRDLFHGSSIKRRSSAHRRSQQRSERRIRRQRQDL